MTAKTAVIVVRRKKYLGGGAALLLAVTLPALFLLHRRPAGIDEKMVTLSGAASLDCGLAEVHMAGAPDKRCGSLPALVGGESVNACTTKAFQSKTAFRGRFNYPRSQYCFGICGDTQGHVYFVSSWGQSFLKQLFNKPPVIHAYLCPQAHASSGGITCGDGRDCDFKYPGG